MSQRANPVGEFVRRIRHRLNRHRVADSALWSVAICGSILLLAGLIYILQGYEVPKHFYIVAVALFLFLVPLIWIFQRHSSDSAATFADRFFDLKDTVSSALQFSRENREGGFYDLQADAAKEKVAELSPARIRYQWPRRLTIAAAVAVVFATLTAFKEPSPEIIEKMRVEEETSRKTAEINEFVEKAVEELSEELEKEQFAEIDPDEIRALPEGLEQTKNQQTALRQYAEMERQLREAARKLERRKEEALLAKVGEELTNDQENRELGRKLKEKDFRKAAEELEAMAPEAPQKEKLSEQRKQLAKLKSAAQRMANAAKSANRQGSTGSSGTTANSQSSGNGMESQLAALGEATSKLDQSLKNAARQSQLNRLDQAMLSQCQSDQQNVCNLMDSLCQSLCKMGAMCDSRKKLLSMCQSMGQCQGYLCQSQSQSLSQCMGTKPGGQKAGNGSVESRTQFSDSRNTGQLENLQGIKGAGPSETMVEDAEDGEGVATRRSVARQREYAKQMESFVQREDVPSAVKEGVKRYFEGIHRVEQ